jgi:hypothetical protein
MQRATAQWAKEHFMVRVIAIALLAVFALVNVGCHADASVGETSMHSAR